MYWKKKIEILSNSTEHTYGVKDKKIIIFACCILHNYLISAYQDEDLIAEVDAELVNQNVSHDSHQVLRSDSDEVSRAGL